MLLRQSTAATLTIGPILDANGAEYTGAVIGDISISKNGTLTALAAGATLTHSANGIYTLALTTGNTDTLGRLQLVCNKSTYQMPLVGANVVPATVYDALVTNAVNTTGGLPAATGTISALAGAISTFAGGAVASVTAPVTVGTNSDKTSYSLSAAANQAIGDAFLAHTLAKGAAGTVERAFWQSSKTSASLTGEVLASGANTATSFLTDIAIDDFGGQVLAMVSGALAGEARAIQSVSSGVVTLQKPLTGTPSAADEFVLIPSQVYAVSEIQSGLATSANQTTILARLGAFTGTGINTVLGFLKAMASKSASTPSDIGGTYSATTDALEAIRDAQAAGTGDASQATLEAVQDTVDAIAARVSGGLIEVTSRVAQGGNLLLYIGDDARVRSGTELEITISDVGGAIYSRLDGLGTAALAFGASRRGLAAGAISGTISGLSQAGSGSAQTATLVVEIDGVGEGLQPLDDYAWQIVSTSSSGDEWVEVEGQLELRRRVAIPV